MRCSRCRFEKDENDFKRKKNGKYMKTCIKCSLYKTDLLFQKCAYECCDAIFIPRNLSHKFHHPNCGKQQSRIDAALANDFVSSREKRRIECIHYQKCLLAAALKDVQKIGCNNCDRFQGLGQHFYLHEQYGRKSLQADF